MTLPPTPHTLLARSARNEAGKGLTGDVYVRKWASTVGKGKDKKTVEHELHINPIGLFGGALLAGATVLAGGVAAYMAGARLQVNENKLVKRIVDEYQPVYTPGTEGHYESRTEQVWTLGAWVPAHWEIIDPNTIPPMRVWVDGYHEPGYWTTQTHDVWVEGVSPTIKAPARVVVMTSRYRPLATYTKGSDLYLTAITDMQAKYRNPINLKETGTKWVNVAGRKVYRHFLSFEADGMSLGIQGFKPRGSLIDVL